MTISNKLFFVTTIGLYIPCITLASEKSHQNNKQYSIEKFNPERDWDAINNLFKKEEHWLATSSANGHLRQHCDYDATCKVLYENDKFAGFIGYKKGHIDYLAV